MDILKYLGQSFPCGCKKIHSLPIKKIIYQKDAFNQFFDFIADLSGKPNKVAIIADDRTFEVAGRYVEKSFIANHISAYHILLKDPAKGIDPLCNEPSENYIEEKLAADTKLMTACGSGVISDLTKWVSKKTHIPYIMAPTAASMNGYSSSNIAPLIGGIKRLMEGTTPLAIIADSYVIGNAPAHLTAAGLGDVLAKPVSTADWKLNNLLFGDYFCEFCANLIKEQEKVYLKSSKGLKESDEKAIEALFFALIFSGIAMTIAGTSAPASGGEHLVSHTLDMLAIAGGYQHDYHGRQVGIGTIFAAALYEKLFEMDCPEFVYLDEKLDENYFGKLTETLKEEFHKKQIRAKRAVKILNSSSEKWQEIKNALKPMLIPAIAIKECLKAAGAAHKLSDIGCTKDYFCEIVAHSHQIRERYTVLDLALATGITKDAIGRIVEEFLTNK
jgi:glycerol-1-phosphate dehydrogenase [NAD(P)+]